MVSQHTMCMSPEYNLITAVDLQKVIRFINNLIKFLQTKPPQMTSTVSVQQLAKNNLVDTPSVHQLTCQISNLPDKVNWFTSRIT